MSLGDGNGLNTQELRTLVRMRRRGMLVYALPNLFTTANLLFGYLSISFAIKGNFSHGAWAILLASLFDLLDGRVARITNTTTKFGVEYDSLCDLVSFGLAPSILLYMASLQEFGRLGLVVSIIFTVCGALRLARFNVFADVLPKSYFQGLPIPIASTCLATFVLFAYETGFSLEKSVIVLCLVLLSGLLMVSTFRFPSFKDIHFRQRRSLPKIALLFSSLILLVAWFETTAFLLILTYILSSLALDCMRWLKRKK